MASSTSKLVPNDPRVEYVTTQLRGKSYRYMIGKPKSPEIDTVFLIHGFPDTSFGWRYQVPVLMAMGFRVVVPDMLGYAGTDAPEDLKDYALKSVSADVMALAADIVGPGKQIILGGHDWGGALGWRIIMWHPELIKGVFVVCTAYYPPRSEWIDSEALISRVPNFQYQLQLMGPDVENKIQGREKLRQFVNGMFGGYGPQRELGFTPEEGVIFNNLSLLGRSRLLTEEELDHYADEYSMRKSPELRGPLNWYRTRKLNHKDELPLAEKGVKFEMPTLFISASRDPALPPSMAQGMNKFFTNLTTAEVDAMHWALVEAHQDVNGLIAKWLSSLLKMELRSNL